MAKRVEFRPDWIKSSAVYDILSVSGCVSEDFADYINFWKHNGYWLFNSPLDIRRVAEENKIDLTNTRLFYYEVHELQYNGVDQKWEEFFPDASFPTQVEAPAISSLEGFDVVTFMCGNSAECSPLSCNSLASDVETNAHCLLDSSEHAMELLEKGAFNNTEPGPYRIFAVYSTPWHLDAQASQ